jgi:hypothetical protein
MAERKQVQEKPAKEEKTEKKEESRPSPDREERKEKGTFERIRDTVPPPEPRPKSKKED